LVFQPFWDQNQEDNRNKECFIPTTAKLRTINQSNLTGTTAA
jgi:hypothetical protein